MANRIRMEQTKPPLIHRVLRKIYYKLVENRPELDRWVRYRDPRKYWLKRGGDPYFGEQEVVEDRATRSRFIAQEIRKLNFANLLEMGCGYGKQLKNLLSPSYSIAGCDFSHTQLLKCKEYCTEAASRIVEADGSAIPFADKSFDLVLSSAVILHNEYPTAQKILSEMIRVSRKYLVHNEDMDITFSRYGYDMKKTYGELNFKVILSKEIPGSQKPEDTQFTIVEIPSPNFFIPSEEIPLQYH